MQVIRPEDVQAAPFDIFDDTFTWPHAEYPLRRIGRLTLDRNVSKTLVTKPSIGTDEAKAGQLFSRYRAGSVLTFEHGSGHWPVRRHGCVFRSRLPFRGLNTDMSVQSFRHASLHTLTLLDTVLGSITSSCPQIAHTSRSTILTNAMAGHASTVTTEVIQTTSDLSYVRWH